MDVVCFLKKAARLGYVLMLLFILMDLNSTPATAQTNLNGITVDAITRTIENPFVKISWDLTIAERVDEFYFKPFSATWNLAGTHYNEFTGGAQAFDRYEFANVAGLVNSQNTNNSWQYSNNGQTTAVNIGSISDTGYQVITRYTFTPDSPVIRVDRTFSFEDKALGGSRLLPYFLRAYDRDNFRRYVWEDESEMINFSENGCETGCTPDGWKQTWIDLEAPDLNVGLGLVNISPTPASELWLDRDVLSSTAFISTSIPNNGFNQDLTVSYMIVPHLGDHTAVDWDSLYRFLDLPIDYSDSVFSVAASGHIADDDERRVNSWFDHSSPDYSKNNDLTKWDDSSFDFTQQASRRGLSWYDGHNGIDFSRNLSQTNEYVYAAANGTVFGVVNNCGGCTTGYGNRVWIDHGNGYATLYGHLASVFVANDTLITNRPTQSLGIIGDTGRSEGIHLHFGLYYDQDDNGIWNESEVVDPFGWMGEGTDPWDGMTSKYLWIPSLHSQNYSDSSGGNYFTPSGFASVEIPNGALNEIITLELWDSSPAAGPLTTLRSTGNSFWMRVLEWLTGGGSPAQLTETAAANSFDVPVTVTVHYDPAMMPHLDTSQLTIKQWDEVGLAWVTLPTTLDSVNQQASAQTTQPGHFDLQAPLVCPADVIELNDNYDGSSITQVNGTLVNNLFDVAADEDWFRFNAVTGNNYVIQTTNLSAGVDTALEIYDTDGVTLLASNDNGVVGNASSLIWQAPQDGLYFARVVQAMGSSFGCSSTYNFSVAIADTSAPTVNTIARVNANPANFASVQFTVTFSEIVTGIDSTDFTMTTKRLTGASITNVSGSGTAYTVTVNTGSGNGTIRLDVVDNNSILDASLNPLGGAAVGDGNFTTGEVYTVIKSSTFADVPPAYWASSFIERLYNAGVTGGCSQVPLNYCPENPVTRAQMAIFLLKGIHGSSYNPPAVGSDTGFADVATNYWAAAWIKQLFAEGITGGCGGGNYCPEANVSRAQMAIFLLKAKHGSAYSPPAATGVFTDVPVGYWARNWIEQLAAEAITSGCGGGNYCPEADVSRAQMAVFLVKTFNLP